jgi:Protein of unknown function (DUF3024)
MATSNAVLTGGLLQPNAFDRKRIERALVERSRYRYVKPAVRMVEGGFRIESPCCSRRIDPDGGVIDIALIHYIEPGVWNLYRKDHTAAQWLLHGTYQRLDGMLEQLKKDPKRLFWQ